MLDKFIAARLRQHPRLIHSPLSYWQPSHETQINIDKSGLEEGCDENGRDCWIEDDGFGGMEHRNIRIPYGGANPVFHDRDVPGDISQRWQRIGTSGWNWEERRSMWVGFDFDSDDGHSVGLGYGELHEIATRAVRVPGVQVRTSKSGKGLHLIVKLDPQPPTNTRAEHKALAKHVLGCLCETSDYDFTAKVDAWGGILWHWERDLSPEGLKVIESVQPSTEVSLQS